MEIRSLELFGVRNKCPHWYLKLIKLTFLKLWLGSVYVSILVHWAIDLLSKNKKVIVKS